jgi:predicted component of type VI protein secretion system
MARLVVLTAGLTGRTCELKVDRTTIGRVEDNAFQIAEPSVSSHHCEVLLRGKDVVVKDLNSTNGTFIDGDQISEAALKPGQVLRLGQVELRLEDSATPAPKKAPATTQAVPQGVKIDDLDSGTRTIKLPADSLFKKKSNKINVVFMFVGLALAGVLIVLFILAVLK